jgi:hypothetical protein
MYIYMYILIHKYVYIYIYAYINLGILDVSEHSYNTVLRSHVGAITFAVTRGPGAEEFVTLGKVYIYTYIYVCVYL